MADKGFTIEKLLKEEIREKWIARKKKEKIKLIIKGEKKNGKSEYKNCRSTKKRSQRKKTGSKSEVCNAEMKKNIEKYFN